MPVSKERTNTEKTFFVQREEGGARIIDQSTGNQFYRTRSGGWFWEVGPGNPFDEDVQLEESSLTNYLNGIAAAADNVSPISSPDLEKKSAS